jgi:hypothetical protein
MPLRLRLTMLLISLSTMGSFAQTIYRVQAGQSLPNALTLAAAGDIIYVDGGIYGNITLSKKVILIGTGYFGAGNTASPTEAKLGTVQFAAGSEGSVIMGFVADNINVGTSTITVARNRVDGHIWVGYSGLGNYGWGGPSVNNVVVKQNYVDDELIASNYYNGTNTVSNFSFRNNIVRAGFASGGRVSGEYVNNTFGYKFDNGRLVTDTGVSGGGTCKLQSAIQYKNNIMTQVPAGGCFVNDASLLPPVFIGNVGVTVSTPGNTVLTTVQRDNLFVGWPTQTGTTISQDARSQLKAGSVALTGGEGGTQAGAFGGDDPYVLGGIPFVPTITQLTVLPLTVTQNGTLNVTVKAQTNN